MTARLYLLFFTLVRLVIVIDTELMIRRNAHLVQQGENDWSFGQTLSVVLLGIPTWDLFVYMRDDRQETDKRGISYVRLATVDSED